MKNKILAVLCALLLISLPGCQLARADAGLSEDEGIQVGALLSQEHLGLFDLAGYLNDNINSWQKGDHVIDGAVEKYQGRLYADLVYDQIEQTKKYVFPEPTGMSFFSVTIPAEGEFEGYKTAIIDDAISAAHIAYDYKDEGESITLEGKLYLTPDYAGRIIYVNPVYQSSDGRVYVLAGDGIMVSKTEFSEGEFMSQTLTDTRTITENGKSSTDMSTIKLTFATMFRPEQIVVMQMDETNKIISRQSFEPGQLPDQLTVEKAAAYLLVETHKNNGSAKTVVTREVFDQSTDTLQTWFTRADGICTGQNTELIWPAD